MTTCFFQDVVSLNSPDDLIKAVEGAMYYKEKHAELAKEINEVKGSIERWASKIGGMTEYCFRQLQDLEAILDYLETKEKSTRSKAYIRFSEHYAKALSHTQVNSYVDSDGDLQNVRDVMQQVAYSRNIFIGLMKALEAINYQLSNVTKLRVAGLDDATLN